jgi:hypothetical protein
MSMTTTLNRVIDGPVDARSNRASRSNASDHAVAHAGQQLLDGVERVLRAPSGRVLGWSLLALHLSRIPAPGPRAHHRRVAAAVLDDAAARGNGQLFALANGDLALLFRPTDDGAGVLGTLARLFKADMPDADALRTLWTLPDAAAPAVAWIRGRVAESDRAPPPPEPPSSTGAVAAMDAVVQSGALSDLMHRQTAVLLRPGRAIPVLPLFREVSISTAVLEARIAGGAATSDPFLFSHLAARLDHRMLGALLQDVPGGGLLSLGLGAAALHVNLTLAGILSPEFARFASACPQAFAAGLRIGVEVPFVEAFADTKSFILARERLRLAGLQMVLDGVSHQVLQVTAPAALEPSLVKLNWSPAMTDAGSELRAAVARLGPDRIVLHRAETEAAIAWGMSHGIMRFQGRCVDAMLASARLRACSSGKSCTLRQCTERASATGPAGRAGCSNLPLLDLSAPVEAPATARSKPAATA